MSTLLKHGRILDPSQDLDMVGDLLIENDQVVGFAPSLDGREADEVYDCTGYWITPGLVDPHVHLREPGDGSEETIVTGTQAAAAGGYTTVCCMPNTTPPLDTPALVDFILDRAASPEAGGVFVAPVGALTQGMRGEQPADLYALKRAGIYAASDEAFPVQNSLVMQRCMEMCVQLDLPIMAHCEDKTLSLGGSMNEGAMSAMLGLKGIPRSAEEIAIMRNCILALNTGCQLHVMRVSTWGAVELIRQAKWLGANVTCEVSPLHFTFTEEAVGEFDTHFKALPPLRTQLDIDSILEALNDGTIDCIASDHSPHPSHLVDAPFEEAPFGSVGLETTVGAALTFLTHRNFLSPLDTVRKLSTQPAAILRLEAGTLKPGETPVAQVTVISPDHEWIVDRNKSFSRSRNNSWHGLKLKGKPLLTFCGGEIFRDAGFDPSRYSASR